MKQMKKTGHFEANEKERGTMTEVLTRSLSVDLIYNVHILRNFFPFSLLYYSNKVFAIPILLFSALISLKYSLVS